MRWPDKSCVWRRHFCLLPHKVAGQWVWLEWIERRFMGDCYEVRDAE